MKFVVKFSNFRFTINDKGDRGCIFTTEEDPINRDTFHFTGLAKLLQFHRPLQNSEAVK